MNFARTPEGELPTLPITPMVDVIFTLLAFFLLATQLVVAERDFGMGYRPWPSDQEVLAQDLPKSLPVFIRRHGSAVSRAP